MGDLMTHELLESVKLSNQEAETLFYSCWDALVKRLDQQLEDNLIVPERELYPFSEIDADYIRDEIRNILRDTMLEKGEKYEIFLGVYEQIFYDLILPSTNQHHKIATSMLTPSIITFEMFNCFIDSWIEDSFHFLTSTKIPENEISAAVDNYLLGLGVNFDLDLVHDLCQDKVKKLKSLEKMAFGSEQFVRLYFKPTQRPRLKQFLAKQLMGEVCDELAFNVMNVKVEQDCKVHNNPVFNQFQKANGLDADNFDITRVASFFKSYRDVIQQNPYLCLDFVTIRVNNKKAGVNDLPFGLLGLMLYKAMLSTVVINLTDRQNSGFCLTEFKGSKADFVLQTYATHVQFNIGLSNLLPFLKEEQIVRSVMKQHLEAVSHLYQKTDMDFKELLVFISTHQRFVANEGFSKNTLDRTPLEGGDKFFTASDGQFYS